ncbi:hyaluronidase-1-like [Hemicordylus capensis]|uniref:hyaluronidase-1-like n=1 Tax=Hemicordylus capensis TaxID=884348 RepID=UPI00230280C9|nr:hyaluronidase-1-like [Hemicordylus capensis]
MWHLWIKYITIRVLLIVVDGKKIMQTRAPLFPNKPFVVFWNAPTEQCRLRYKVDLDLKIFDIISNANETLSGSTVTIFYYTHLGYYPYVDDNNDSINGGIPQNQSLFRHLTKAKSDIDHAIPMKKFHGLGVIDWENWRPQWDRNWGQKAIYKNKSLELVRKLHPQWPEETIKKVAKEEFENAGKSFMNSTLFLAQHMRPNGLWGYYLFPDCYNYYKENPHTYTGKCPDVASSRNDRLLWLWKQSTALYPSIYLNYTLKSSPNALKFVHYRVKEALRIASIARKDYALPVFVYSRPFYAYSLYELTEDDLVHTIGESAALGAAGVVLWGSLHYANSSENCLTVKKYINGPLGHYVINVTSAAKLCSKVLCKKNGRCIRKISDSNTHLHLSPQSFKIRLNFSKKGNKVDVRGNLKKEDEKVMREKFICQCYQGWTGMFCEMPDSSNSITKLLIRDGTPV